MKIYCMRYCIEMALVIHLMLTLMSADEIFDEGWSAKRIQTFALVFLLPFLGFTAYEIRRNQKRETR